VGVERWLMKSQRPLPLIEPRKLLRDFPVTQRHLIGVSGGRDSVALLHSLVDLGYKKLIVCHLNHQLRGRSSDADALFVEKLATKYDLDLEMGSANVRALATKQKISIEAAAREARYKFFALVAKQRRARTIFLGHHADDLVETFLREVGEKVVDRGFWAQRDHRLWLKEGQRSKPRPFPGCQNDGFHVASLTSPLDGVLVGFNCSLVDVRS